MTENIILYLVAAATAFAVSAALTPLVRACALRLNLMDTPATAIKTHKQPTPALGGIAIASGVFAALALIRLFTHFPTGTLRNLRGIMLAGLMVLILGIIDDVKKPGGLGVVTKFAIQIGAALILVMYGMSIQFITPDYLAIIVSVIWVVGICNAMNIIDIMDGFSSSQAAIAALGFLLIALPYEALYVNFTAAALAGAALGFMPYNFSTKRKIFMGDCGSLFLGINLAALAMGTKYDHANNLGVLAPLLILAIPIYDTLFVAVMRMLRGSSPFAGSKDHYALRLEKMGLTRHQVVGVSAVAALLLSGCALAVTKIPLGWALALYGALGLGLYIFSRIIARVKMTDGNY